MTYDGPDRREEDQMQADIEELAVGLLGPKRTDLQGGGRRKEVGIVHRVGVLEEGQVRIEHTLTNGLEIRLLTREKVALYVAAIGAVGVVVSAVVAAF